MADTDLGALATDKTLERVATALETMAGKYTPPSDLTYSDISKLVRAGYASAALKVGDQVVTKLSGNGQSCDFAWDVVHHFDGSDDAHPLVTLNGGEKVRGMMLQAHRAVPWSIAFCPKQALIAVTGDMPAGSYTFDVDTKTVWGTGVAGAVGVESYTFTTTQPLAAGAQIVWNASYSAKPTSASSYASKTSDSPVETLAIASGASGTKLGTVGDESSADLASYCKLNNVERSCEGSNRWKTSQLRASLNADGAVSQGGGEFDRPWGMVGKTGLLACLPAEFTAVLGEVERRQETHGWDGGAVDVTYDRLFPVSAREHGFNNYLSTTTAGFNGEGVPLDYWENLKRSAGRESWLGWQTYPELITYDAVSTSVARYVWLRSASRYRSTACNVGCVNTSGSVSHTGAHYGYFAAPACLIV